MDADASNASLARRARAEPARRPHSPAATTLYLKQMDFQQEIVQIQDTLIVMAEIQRRQAEVRRIQSERIVLTEEGMKLHEGRMNHVDERLSEITDKLDGLIGLDGQSGKH